jgi:hypothetical protein
MFEAAEKFLAGKKKGRRPRLPPRLQPRTGLEHEPHAQLNISRAGLAGDAPEVGVRRIHFDTAKVRVIEEVERLRPYLQPAGCTEREVLEQRKIPLYLPPD